MALAEDAASWEPETWRASVEDGRVRGAKCFAPHAALADVLLVGVEGGELALVESGSAGVAIADQDGVDRTRPIARVEFEGALCDPLSGGADAARRVRDAGANLLAADAFGAAWRLIQPTLRLRRRAPAVRRAT